jgi:hypothetical protein
LCGEFIQTINKEFSMAAQTGRSIGRFMKVQIGDSSNVLRDIPVLTINGVGLTYAGINVVALQDAVKGVLPDVPTATVTISGPFDSTAAVTASATTEAAKLSGSHTVLSALVGGTTPRTLGVYIGMRQPWVSGEPVWGLAQSATSGFLVLDYTVDAAAGTYTATLGVFPGSSAPAWGTTQLS